MSSAQIGAPARTKEASTPRSERGPAPTHILVSYGFWIFLLSDVIIFGALFAVYAVLGNRTAGGPTGMQLFDREHVLIETACLLLSSFTCGMFTIAVERKHMRNSYVAAIATFVLGLSFILLEVSEFRGLIADGNGPSRSAFLSSFFALVGMHGTHVTIGLVWLLVMIVQMATLGLRPTVVRRLMCFSLFWHALDIVWVGVFTIVYLGAGVRT